MEEMKLFRAPCGAAGLYNQDTVIQAYCGAADDGLVNCKTCPDQGRCEYMRVLDSMPYGFSWEGVCGWEAAEEREAELTASEPSEEEIEAERVELFCANGLGHLVEAVG